MIRNQAAKATTYGQNAAGATRVQAGPRQTVRLQGATAPGVPATTAAPAASSGSTSSDGTPSNGATAAITGQLQNVGLVNPAADTQLTAAETAAQTADAAEQAAREEAARQEAARMDAGAQRLLAGVQARHRATEQAERQAQAEAAEAERQQRDAMPDPNDGAPNAPGGRGVGGMHPVSAEEQTLAQRSSAGAQVVRAACHLMRKTITALDKAKAYVLKRLPLMAPQEARQRMEREARVDNLMFSREQISGAPDMSNADAKVALKQIMAAVNLLLEDAKSMPAMKEVLTRVAQACFKVPDGIEATMAVVKDHAQLLSDVKRVLQTHREELNALGSVTGRVRTDLAEAADDMARAYQLALLAGYKSDDIVAVIHQLMDQQVFELTHEPMRGLASRTKEQLRAMASMRSLAAVVPRAMDTEEHSQADDGGMPQDPDQAEPVVPEEPVNPAPAAVVPRVMPAAAATAVAVPAAVAGAAAPQANNLAAQIAALLQPHLPNLNNIRSGIADGGAPGNNTGNQPNTQAQVGQETRAGAEGTGQPSGWRMPTVPAPQKFSGEDGHDLNTAMFHFENYLKGNRVPRDMWPAYAQSLLTGTAAKQYTAHAQSLNRAATWEDFKAALKIFENPQQARQASLDLMDLVQTKTVRDYIQRFNLLRVKSGTTAGEEHLIQMFHRGLKDKESVALNPATGKWWESLQDLTEYVLSKETTLNTKPKGGNEGNLRVAGGVRKTFGFKRHAHPAAKLKAAFVRTQGGGNGRRPNGVKQTAGFKRNRDHTHTDPGSSSGGGKQGSADDFCGICLEVQGKQIMHKGADSRDCRNYAKWKAAKAKKAGN
jgi:hypothetical protein